MGDGSAMGKGGSVFGGGCGGSQKGKSDMRPGDWMCPACGDLQFAKNANCRQCGMARPADAGGPPMKRPRDDGPGTGDPEKDEFVRRIKAYQRAGESEKQQWWDYCDRNLGGKRDPARHDVRTLEDFTL